MGIKELFRRYKSIFIVFAVFIIIYFFSLQWKDSFFPWLDSNVESGFSVSLYASFFEDLIFFGVIGLLTILVTTKKPEDEEISYRIRSVTNAKHVSDSARDYFEKKTREVLAYNSNLEVKIKIKEKIGNNIKLYVEFNNTIRNMCKDVSFTEVRTKAVVRPPVCVNKEWGTISHLTIVDKKDFLGKKVVVEGDIIELTEKGFYWHEPYKISEDSEASYKFCYTIWSEVSEDDEIDNNWFYTVVSRYTDSFSVELENQLEDTQVPIIVRCRDRNSNIAHKDDMKKFIIREKDSMVLAEKVRMHPEDKFQIFFELHPKRVKQSEEDISENTPVAAEEKTETTS